MSKRRVTVWPAIIGLVGMRRVSVYWRQNRVSKVTPRQWQRIRHKANRFYGGDIRE